MNTFDRPDLCTALSKNARKRQRRTSTKRFSRLALRFFVAAALVTSLLFIVGASSTFTVSSIEITGNTTLASGMILTLAEVESGRNFFTYSAARMTQRLNNHPWIQTVTVQKIFPNRLTIGIVQERPFAIVYLPTPQGRTLYYVNNQGVPFAPASGSDLDYPVVTFEADAQRTRDKAIQARLRDAVAIIQHIDHGNSQILPLASISQINIQEGDRGALFLVDHTFPIHLTMSGFRKKFRTLEYVLKNLQNRNELEQTSAIFLDYNDSGVLVRQHGPRNHG